MEMNRCNNKLTNKLCEQSRPESNKCDVLFVMPALLSPSDRQSLLLSQARTQSLAPASDLVCFICLQLAVTMASVEKHPIHEGAESPAKKVNGPSDAALFVHMCGVYVKDQEKALKFFTEVLGCTVHTDKPFGPGKRWIEVQPPGGGPTLSLFTPEKFEDRVGTFSNVGFCTFVHCEIPHHPSFRRSRQGYLQSVC